MAETAPFIKERLSIQELERRYKSGDKRPLENVLRAFKYMQEMDPANKQSYFTLAGYHGVSGDGFPQGFCSHQNVLFPIWHRAYLLAFEQSMQDRLKEHGHEGWETVGLPFLDSCGDDIKQNGLPKILTDNTVTLDGQTVKNPLQSYVLQARITDNDGVGYNYTHPKGYETVRYPFSCIRSPPEDATKAEAHNKEMMSLNHTEMLNQNLRTWLSGGSKQQSMTIIDKYKMCLQAPTYTALSNLTSASSATRRGQHSVVSLESPHNDLHVAIGGFTAPSAFARRGSATGANGDMGSTNVAAFDPIFWLHHCFVDYALWRWQLLHSATDEFTIDVNDPGATGVGGDLSMKSPLEPFEKPGGGFYTPTDLVNIIPLGYTYGGGSLDKEQLPAEAPVKDRVRLSVAFSRAQFQGSVVVHVTAVLPKKEVAIGYETILSRFNMAKCENCMLHVDCRVPFSPTGILSAEELKVAKYRVDFQYHKLASTLKDRNAIKFEVKLNGELYEPLPQREIKSTLEDTKVEGIAAAPVKGGARMRCCSLQ